MLKKIDDLLETCENWIMVVTGITVCLLIFISAMMRYIIKVDFYGYEEIVLFCAFWLYFMGSSVAAKKGTHINANMMSMFCHNRKILASSELLKTLVSLVVCVVATVWCWNYVLWSFQMGAKSNVFKLPNVIAQIPMFISFFLWMLYLIRDILKDLKQLKAAVRGEEGVSAC